MNFMPEPVESKPYVGSIVTEYQQPFQEDLTLKKSATYVEDCYDSIAKLGKNDSPSAATEFKRTDTCLEDLDTNADTTSVPDSEYVSEYFDIYGSNDSLNKVYSGLPGQHKWEEPLVLTQESSKDPDSTTTSTILSDSCFKFPPLHSSNLFFEDDFRYVTKLVNSTKPFNLVSDFSDKTEFYMSGSQPFPVGSFKLSDPSNKEMLTMAQSKFPESNKDQLSGQQPTKEELMDKAELATTSFAQLSNTIANLTNGSNANVGSGVVVANLVTPSLVNTNLLGNNLGSNFTPYDMKRQPFFLNTPMYSGNTMMESDLYLSPSLANKCYNLVSNYPANSNYCVYMGADYNKLVCSCNMNRPNGSNSHATNCNVVAGGVELSTESWPISRASQMYDLINTWDRVMRNKRTPPKTDFNGFFLADPYKTNMFMKNDEEKGPKTTLNPVSALEHLKNANNLISEITGIKLNVEAPDKFVYRNGHCEHGKNNEVSKRRKTNKKPQEHVNLPRELDLSITTEDDPKLDRREIHQPNTEKVSGVWYDTNRHLWRVVYMKGNKRKTQGFSSLKLGYEEARRKAIQMRHEMVALRHTDKI